MSYNFIFENPFKVEREAFHNNMKLREATNTIDITSFVELQCNTQKDKVPL